MGHDHAGHGHDRALTPERALWIALLFNGAFLVVEAVAGWWTGSLALLADAGHMVSDVIGLAVALIAVRASRQIATARFTFGLRRTPVLGALFNGLSLVAIAVFVVVEAVPRFRAPPALDGMVVLWTGVAGLAINLGSAWYLSRASGQSVNTRGAMLHLLADALGSVAAVISGVGLMWGVPLADPIASLVIAVMILVASAPLLRDTVFILLQRAPMGADVERLRATILAHPAVESIEEMHLWAIDVDEPILSAVLRLDVTRLDAANAFSDALRAQLRAEFAIAHATLECRVAPLPDDAPRC